MNKILYLLFVCLLVQSKIILAHPGGHYHNGDGIVLNSWTLKSGRVIKGNFSFARGNSLFLEQEDGFIKPVLINELSVQDQQLARFKINKYAALNDSDFVDQKVISTDQYRYVPIGLLCILVLMFFSVKNQAIQQYVLNSRIGLSTISVLFLFCFFIACSKSEVTNSSTPISNPISVIIPKTSYTFIDSAFSAFKPAITTTWDDTYFYVASTGLPNHNMMIGITNWQQQVPVSQPYNGTNSWSIPLQPVYASIPLSTKTNLMKGAVAIAVNGIPIFNALNNRGEDSYKIGELDNWGGHCGKGDDYHYHAAPLHLSTMNVLKPIAFAVDGFAVYGSKEPDGATMIALDTCHGHVGTSGLYHYHGTTDYPYVVGAMRGKVILDPSTTAPENQVLPQAFTKPVRPATSPLSGAAITDFTAVGTNGYLLTYKRGNKNGYIKYSWGAFNKYTFILTDTSGSAVTNTYQR